MNRRRGGCTDFGFWPGWVLVLCILLPACAPVATDVKLGDRIAGSWLGTFEVDVAGFSAGSFIRTYHADGTGLASSSRAFGAGDTERNGLSNVQHFVWEQVGEREIRWKNLHFRHDADGVLTGISRTHGIVTFDEELLNCTGTFTVELFAPEALLEPLDPNAQVAPLFAARGSSRARRL